MLRGTVSRAVFCLVHHQYGADMFLILNMDQLAREGRDGHQLWERLKLFLQRGFPNHTWALCLNSPAKMQLQISVIVLS